MSRKNIFIVILFFVSTSSLLADEGMWMLHLLKQQKYPEMKALGLKLQDYDIYNPNGASIKDAIVQFGSGCTGEVVSSQGLVLTNHHCGYGSIQNHSSLEHNYLENGFWAMTMAQELPNPNLTVTFIDKIEDVTDYVKHCLARDSAKDSLGVFYLSPSYLNSIAREKVGVSFLKKHYGTQVEIKPFFDGNSYFMFTKKVYADIRLVGAPPSSIGKFGADTDNWMWPRHSGDFSIFRIYADRNGNPAPYSPENIPLKPKRWLKISTKGVKKNDFAMIMGFPGTTNQYYTSWEVVEKHNIDNSVRIHMREVRQKAMLKEMLKDPAVKIQYSAKYAGSTNSYKSAIGSNWAIDKFHLEKIKKKQQDKLIDWAKKNGKKEYPEALTEIEKIVEKRKDFRFRNWMLFEGIMRGVEFSSIPMENADSLIAALQENNEAKIKKYIAKLLSDYHHFANKDYNPMVDRKVSTAMIQEYIRLVSRDKQPKAFEEIYTRFNGNTTKYVNYLFDQSVFGSEENMKNFLEKNLKADILLKDPMINFIKSVREENHYLKEQLFIFNRSFYKARQEYEKGILAMDGVLTHWPDANLTLRLTYGQVRGYSPRDDVSYGHQTTMDGIMEKEDSTNWEFVVPPKLKELYRQSNFGHYAMSNGKMPVDFTATTHTTGGNSGSPVMNGNGELIGINFDRNWEGVGGDIQYLPDYQRSIIADIRYILFIIDKYAGANNLIQEMDLR